MKKILIILTTSFCLFNYGQTVKSMYHNDIKSNDMANAYFKDLNNDLNKFTGLWEFNNGTHHLKIRFYKVNEVKGWAKNQYMDEIHSFMEYRVREGNIWVTKYNTFPFPNATSGECGECFIGTSNYNPNKLSGVYYEPSDNCQRLKQAFLDITYSLNGNTPQLQWERKAGLNSYSWHYFPCPGAEPVDTSEFIIPANMVLTKIAD